MKHRMAASLAGLLQRLRREEQGAAAIMTAAVLVMLLGVGGLAIDGSHLYVTKTMLQSAADEAARAAVKELPSVGQAQNRAILLARQNMPPTEYGEVLLPADVVVGIWNSGNGTFTPDNSNQANAVQVTTRRNVPLSLASVFGLAQSTVVARATALRTLVAGYEACVLALQTIETGIEINGNVEIVMPTCALAANSSAVDAFEVNGSSAYIEVQTIVTVGGLDAHPTTLNLATPAISGAVPAIDPYTDLPTNFSSLTARTCTGSGGKCSGTLQPGRYASAVTLTGDVTLAPGMYYFAGGVSVSGQTQVSGIGVTFAYSGNVKLSGNNVSFDIRAPTGSVSNLADGIQGVALYGVGATARLDVNAADAYLDGAVYSPQGFIDIGGNGALAGCSQVVAGAIRMHGTPSARTSCANVPLRGISVGGSSTSALVN